jgi:hypothetical protein
MYLRLPLRTQTLSTSLLYLLGLDKNKWIITWTESQDITVTTMIQFFLTISSQHNGGLSLVISHNGLISVEMFPDDEYTGLKHKKKKRNEIVTDRDRS